jgi:hypothetical protein
VTLVALGHVKEAVVVGDEDSPVTSASSLCCPYCRGRFRQQAGLGEPFWRNCRITTLASGYFFY